MGAMPVLPTSMTILRARNGYCSLTLNLMLEVHARADGEARELLGHGAVGIDLDHELEGAHHRVRRDGRVRPHDVVALCARRRGTREEARARREAERSLGVGWQAKREQQRVVPNELSLEQRRRRPLLVEDALAGWHQRSRRRTAVVLDRFHRALVRCRDHGR